MRVAQMHKRQTDQSAEQMPEHHIPWLDERHIWKAEYDHSTRAKRTQHKRIVQTLHQQRNDRDSEEASSEGKRDGFARSAHGRVATEFGERIHGSFWKDSTKPQPVLLPERSQRGL
jgi:uncharacterized NAD(P)/FAD-binding protein YdhS